MYDKNGELIGFELDIARQLAADMGGRGGVRADRLGTDDSVFECGRF